MSPYSICIKCIKIQFIHQRVEHFLISEHGTAAATTASSTDNRSMLHCACSCVWNMRRNAELPFGKMCVCECARMQEGKRCSRGRCEWIRWFWLLEKILHISAMPQYHRTNSKEKQRKMPRNGIKCEGRWFCIKHACIDSTYYTCNMTFFWVAVSASLEKYEQLLPFYYLCVCKSDSFYSVTFFQLLFFECTQTEAEAFRILFLIASLGALKRTFDYAVFSLHLRDISNKLQSTFSISTQSMNMHTIVWMNAISIRRKFFLHSKLIK